MRIRKYIISALSAVMLPAAAIAQEKTPVVDYLYNDAREAYFYIDPDTDLEKLTLDIYDNVRTRSKIATIDLLSEELAQRAVEGMENTYLFPIEKSDDQKIVYQLIYKYPGSAEVTSKLYDGDEPFIYMTDLPRGTIEVGWHIPFYDIAYNGAEPLRTTTSTYAKGYGVHAPGYVETALSVDLSQFSRFRADLGGQIISNPTRGKLGYAIYNPSETKRLDTGNLPWESVVEVDFEIIESAPGDQLKVVFTNGGDGNTNDIVCIGAPRFYYKNEGGREPQTILFDNPDGPIFDDNPQVALQAHASGGTPVTYSIIKGAEFATLEGNILTPKEGINGEVTIQAMTLGDRNFKPASATQTFNFRFGPVVEYLYTHPNTENPTEQTLYVYADGRGKAIEKLTLDIYDNVRSFTNIKTVDLLEKGLSSYAVKGLKNVYAIPLTVPGGGTIVQRVTYRFAGEDEVEGPLCEGSEPFVYMTDLPRGPIQVGWHIPFYDEAYNGTEPLRSSTATYGKGYGVHAPGYVETASSVDLSQFSRFCVDVGGQIINNPTRGNLGFKLYNGISQPYLNTGNVGWSNVYEWDFPLQATSAGKTVKLEFTNGGDGNTNDIVCIGAPRFYYNYEQRLPQTIEWEDEVIINDYVKFTMPVTAKASSGLPVLARVIKGKEFARIDANGDIEFYEIPSEGEVVVEAYQPGNKDYEPSNIATCSFRIRKAMIIPKSSRIELQGGNDIDELVIFADANSSGQAVVKDGIVNVKKLVLRYTFTPGEWNYISFPSDLNLEKISDLTAKGFTCAADEGINNTYLIRYYDSRQRSEFPSESPWVSVTSGQVEGMKGYIMKLESDDPEPVEITFNIDNVTLDFENKLQNINVAVDMSKCEPETRHTVYVRPTNVKGNTLRVDMRYVPASREDLPLNHERALEAMRVIPTGDGAIRLTLPEQTPARVAIFDKKGKKMLKAVQYVAPMKIDVSDLKRGTYRMVVLYGPASTERELKL